MSCTCDRPSCPECFARVRAAVRARIDATKAAHPRPPSHIAQVKETWTNAQTGEKRDTPPPGLDPESVAKARAAMKTPERQEYAPGENPATTPTLTQKAGNLVFALAKFVGSGGKLTVADDLAKRQAACAACPHLSGSSCQLCGCWLPLKQRMDSERCPIGKW